MLSSETPRARSALTLALIVSTALLAGCAGAAPESESAAHRGGHAGTASPSPHASATASADADLDDDDFDDDGDFDDDDLDAAGLKKKDVDAIDDDDDLKDYLDDARRASHPDNATLLCVAVHPEVDDVIESSVSGAVDEVAAAQADDGVGYLVSVALDDGRVALLYATSSPVGADFAGELYAANDLASAVSTFTSARAAGIDVSSDTGMSRAPLCL